MAAAMGASAWGADLPTRKEATPAPVATGPASCTDPVGFFTTDCVLSYWGVTFYGAVDAGVGWESHGVALNRNIISGVQELINKSNKNAMFVGTFTDIAGITVVAADITNTAYTIPRVEQVFWTGARYRFTETIDTGVAYYHYYQSNYAAVPCSNSSSSKCSGTLDAVSFDVDWQFAKKFDAYAGVMFSEVNNGLSNGFVHGENLAPTVGLRFRF